MLAYFGCLRYIVSTVFLNLRLPIVYKVPGEITQLLLRLNQGDRDAEASLIPLVYEELKRIAAARLRSERDNLSIQPTVLVHEAYLRLTGLSQVDWQSRNHFYAISATIMRRILVDHARARRAAKRGTGETLLVLEEANAASGQPGPDILALDEALDRLAKLDARQARIVDLRFFTGLTEEEIGTVLGITARTVKRDWRVAKAWLFAELSSV